MKRDLHPITRFPFPTDQTMPIVNRATGEIRQAQIFVAVWGASNYTYAEATWTQQLPDWIGSHVRALEWFSGCPEMIIPDNLRNGISRACRYEPDLNPIYQEFAAHYGVTILPAHVRKPQDKAKGEKGVQTVENWILALLRHFLAFQSPIEISVNAPRVDQYHSPCVLVLRRP